MSTTTTTTGVDNKNIGDTSVGAGDTESMEHKRRPDVGPADTRGFMPLFAAAQVFAIISVILTIVWCSNHLGGFDWSNPSTRFNWHPVLMIVSFVFLYGNGMLVYRFMRNEAKYNLKILHGIINLLAFLLSTIALFAAFSFHNNATPPIANMYSLHSWIGLSTVILFGLNLVGGLAFFLLPYAPDHLRTAVLPFHVFSGQILMALIVICIMSGITEKALFTLKTGATAYANLPPAAYLLNFLGISVIIFFLIVTFAVTRPEYKRRPLSTEIPIRLAMQESTH